MDSPLDSPASGSESSGIELSSVGNESVTDSNVELSSNKQKGNRKQAKSSSNYFNNLTLNFDTISGILAVIFIALGTCIMYFQNNSKLGSYLLGIAVLIGLFHSFIRVYLSDFKVGNHGSSSDGSNFSEPDSTDSDLTSSNSE